MDTQTSDHLVGRLLDGRYRVGARVARGGMATVYEALDTRLDRVVALKVMHVGMGDDDGFARKFVQEARSAARLSHPNVVAVFDQGTDDGTPFLAMEYVPGRTLREVVRQQAPMAPARALDLLSPVLSALSAAHDAGIVHRDIKPENVLIAGDGTVKVADFGLSRAVSASSSTSTQGLLMGTVSYLAPELVTDGSADARSDVYSAGIMLYEMLTGEKPHGGDTPIQVAYRHVHADVPLPSRIAPHIPPYVDALVQRATARSRDLRPADARVFARQVRRVRSALEEGLPDDPELTGDLTIPILAPYESGPYDDAPGARQVPQPNGHEYNGRSYNGGRRDDLRSDTLIVAHDRAQLAAAAAAPAPPKPAAPTTQVPRRRRWRGLVALVAVLALAAGVGGAAWYYGVQRYTTTPDLTRLTAAQARDRAAQDQLSTVIGGQAFSEDVRSGVVLATEPGVGERILKDGEVSLTVSKGRERYKVPRLTGMDLDAARSALATLNLRLTTTGQAYSETIAEGKVVSQSLPMNQVVKRDTSVGVVLSKGKQPIAVPSYIGRRATEARRGLGRLGFAVATTEEFSESVAKGRVISQSPSSGVRFAKDKISLVVSKGPQLVKVPSVWRKQAKDARKTLEKAGFKVKVERAALYIGVGIVAAQKPSANAMAKPGSTVVITVV